MSSTAEALDVLSCPICMDTFNTPKILRCGHSLCLTPCLAELDKQPDPVCPLCRTVIVLPPSGEIDDMITNFSVKNILDILKKTSKISPEVPCHTQEYGDYVCLTCLQQICSCCQLSYHIDTNHKCIPVPEFRENLQKDVSKMNAVVNESRWLEQMEHGTTALIAMPTYLNLKDKLTTDCYEIILSSSQKKLELKKIRQLQKKVRSNHPKFIAARQAVEAKMKLQLAEYRQKLIEIKFSENVCRKNSFFLKISSFENLKEKTRAAVESFTKQMQTKSFHARLMEEKLQHIVGNIEKVEKLLKDTTREYQKCLLGEIGVTYVVEPHHLFRLQEVVDMMSFGSKSKRHSEDILKKCKMLTTKFQVSKDFVKTSCGNLLQKYHYRSFQLTEAEERVLKVVEEVDNCKLYFDRIYDVIGEQFVHYDERTLKHYVQNHFITRDASYVLQLKGKTQVVKKHLDTFESHYKRTTKKECQDLIVHLSDKGLTLKRNVIHNKFKAIEMRLAETEYHCTLLTSMLSKELRCHEISMEFKCVFQTDQPILAKLRESNDHNVEIQRLWRVIEEHEPTIISFDVHFITGICKNMEERRNSVFSALKISKSELKAFGRKISYLKHVMELRAQLYKGVHGMPNQLSDTYKLHQQELKELDVLFEITNSDTNTTVASFRRDSLQNLVLLLNHANELEKLYHRIRAGFVDECSSCCDRISSLQGAISSDLENERWNALTQENISQWETVINHLKNERGVNVLFFDKAINLHHKVEASKPVRASEPMPTLTVLIGLVGLLFKLLPAWLALVLIISFMFLICCCICCGFEGASAAE